MERSRTFDGPLVDADTDGLPTVFDRIVLWRWRYTFWGAVFEVDLVYYPPHRFCYEGELTYAGVVKIADGELCVEQSENGSVRVHGDAQIKIFGKKVATAKGEVDFRVDYDAGYVYLDRYEFEVCGSNSVRMKCKDWDWSRGRDALVDGDEVFIPLQGSRSESEFANAFLFSLGRIVGPRARRIGTSSVEQTEELLQLLAGNGGIVDNG